MDPKVCWNGGRALPNGFFKKRIFVSISEVIGCKALVNKRLI